MSTARAFNGTTDFAQSASNLDFTGVTSLAVEFWFKPQTTASDGGLVCYQDGVGNRLFTQDYGGAIFGDACAQRTFTAATSAAPTGAWNHLVMCITLANGAVICQALYINNVSLSHTTNANASAQSFGSFPLLMGAFQGPNTFLQGSLAQVGIWVSTDASAPQVLSATEIGSLFTGANPLTLTPAAAGASLKYYWDLAGTASPEPPGKGGIAMNLTGTTQDTSGPPYGPFSGGAPPKLDLRTLGLAPLSPLTGV